MKVFLALPGVERPAPLLEELRAALHADPDLRRVTADVVGGEPDGTMNGLGDGLLVVFGAGGLGVTVAQAVAAWLAGRRPSVKLTVTGASRTVEIDMKVRDPQQIVDLLRQIDELSGDAGSGR